MVDVRCKGCNKLFAKCSMFIGVIKCNGCGMIFEYKIIPNLTVNEMYAIKESDSFENITHNG